MITKTLNKIDNIFIKNYCKQNAYKPKEIETFLIQLKDSYLEYTSTAYNDQEINDSIETFTIKPTHVLSLDLLTGGITNGLVQLYGWEDTFKTTLAVYISSLKETSFYINSDNHPFRWIINNEGFKQSLGGYRTNDLVKTLVSIGMVDHIVVDSISSLNRSLDLIKTTIKLVSGNPDLTLFFTNQTRSSRYSNTEAAGPDFLHSMCSMIISIESVDKKLWTGSLVRYKIERFKPNNKLNNTFFDVYYNTQGNVSNEIDIISRAQTQSIIKRIGTKFEFKNCKYSLNDLINNVDVLTEIWNIVITPINPGLNANDYLGRSLINKNT